MPPGLPKSAQPLSNDHRKTGSLNNRPILRVRQSLSCDGSKAQRKRDLSRSLSKAPVPRPKRQTKQNSRNKSGLTEAAKITNENDSGRESPEIPLGYSKAPEGSVQSSKHSKKENDLSSCQSHLTGQTQLSEIFQKGAHSERRTACRPKKSNNRGVHEKQTVLPEYFTLRKSLRLNDALEQMKTKREREHQLLDAILNGEESGFCVRVLPDKGRAVFANRAFQKGDFVLEYAGKLRSLKDARHFECLYSDNQSLGCFMFYFKYLCKSYCIDATEESSRLGRLVNHSRYRQNLVPKVVSVNGHPRLVLIANKTIAIGDELLYDYGDRSAAALRAHPWLAE